MLLIKNGEIHDGKGNVFENTDLLIQGKTIVDLGKNLEFSAESEVYDASGKVVFPGFIDSLNVWGAVGPGWGDTDLGEHSDPVSPELDVVYSFDQDSMVFQRVFDYGITSAGITPSTANVLGGFAAVFKTYGDHPYKMLVRDQVGMVASITKKSKLVHGSQNIKPMTRMGAFSLLKETMIKAQAYGEKESKDYDAKLEALQKVIKGQLPLFLNCASQAEMEAAEILLKDLPVEVVFTGAYGVHEKTGQILGRPFSLILGDRTEALSAYKRELDLEAIQILLDQGVDIAISSTGDSIASGKESLLWNAILYYKEGLAAEKVLEMITSLPAKILGVEDKIGSLEVGKEADLVVWTDNPIKTYQAQVEASFINGENILHARREKTCWS